MAFEVPYLAVTVAAAVCVAGGSYTLYRSYLPKPVPGIPYNKKAIKYPWGDIPELAAHLSSGGNFYLWILDQMKSQNSPIKQVFLGMSSGPTIILADYRESRDIEVHRGIEFDRDSITIDSFTPLAVTQFTMLRGPQWKLHRSLMQDTMTPTFLDTVAAPSIYESCLRLIELWNMKAAIAGPHAFSAKEDIHHAAYDAVLAFTFGSDFPHSAIGPQIEELNSKRAEIIQDQSPVEFPSVPLSGGIDEVLQMTDYLGKVHGQPLPRWRWAYYKRTRRFRQLKEAKNQMIKTQIKKAVDQFMNNSHAAQDTSKVRNAVDHIIDRECKRATKQKEAPNFYSDMISSEIYGMIIAGHDTTSSTISWGVKLLTDNPRSQEKLRSELQKAFSDAYNESRMPTVNEINKTSVPYLDAAIEEILRVGNTAPLGVREAMQDTTVLGYTIPKGTSLIYLKKGPGTFAPSLEVDENTRSSTSQQDAKTGKVNMWDDEGIEQFNPERWLKFVERTEGLVFDINAGPNNVFGRGFRGCFGRRLAYLQLRILLTLIIWNFRLLECPKELSNYDARLSLVYKALNCYVRLESTGEWTK